MNLLQKIFKNGFLTFFSLFITALLLGGCIVFYMYLELPDVSTIKNMQLQLPLRVYTRDGKLLAEYGEAQRIPVSLDEVPHKLIQAVLATEDQRYFEHPGVDFIGLIRATREVLISGRPSQGGSTITMQVARNYFLTRQKKMGRKLKEILLALKIDATLSKEKVLELYLNRIYLGQRAYGVAAAAQVYYGKNLKQLSLPEIALLAGLPQAPSRDNPIDNPRAAQERRNHVLERMLANGYITEAQYQQSALVPITTHLHKIKNNISAPYVGEMVRAAMVEAYGNAAYTSGLKVYTTIDSELQAAANLALRNGLLSYDKRHGYRKPEKRIRKSAEWRKKLQELSTLNGLSPAIVVEDGSKSLIAMLPNGRKVFVSKSNWKANLKKGDVIRIQTTKSDSWELSQLPQAESALVSLNPNSGEVLALTGGFSFQQSPYNRATQAKRQPGSSFKPFIYSAALEKGYTLASLFDDAPLVQYIPGTKQIWRPQNANQTFYGPTRLRMGLVHSRNLVSIRVLQAIGIPYAIDYATHFGFDRADLPNNLTMVLGTGSVTPMQLTTAYATFANGGYLVKPYFIHHITDNDGKLIYQADIPKLEPAISPETAYLMNTVLQDVIRLGTGRRALVLNRQDLAGKTGTTSNHMDAWFAGYNGDIVTTVWVGFDQHQSLREFGNEAALPIWIEYMRTALNGKPERTLSQPSNIIRFPIDRMTGQLSDDRPDAIYEYFEKSNLPKNTPDYANDQSSGQLEEPKITMENPDSINLESPSNEEIATTEEGEREY